MSSNWRAFPNQMLAYHSLVLLNYFILKNKHYKIHEARNFILHYGPLQQILAHKYILNELLIDPGLAW